MMWNSWLNGPLDRHHLRFRRALIRHDPARGLESEQAAQVARPAQVHLEQPVVPVDIRHLVPQETSRICAGPSILVGPRCFRR